MMMRIGFDGNESWATEAVLTARARPQTAAHLTMCFNGAVNIDMLLCYP
jgi:hypothetical protein